MQRIKTSTAVTSLPAYEESGAPGYFTDGDAVAGTPATVVGQDWLNQVQGEIINAIKAADLTPSATDDTQLAQAIAKLIAAQAVTVEEATETVAGIIKLATLTQAIAGLGGGAITPVTLGGAVAGTVRGYTAQQYAAPVVRTDASGSQAVDCDAHQLLSITATGALAFAAPTHLGVGKSVRIMIYSAASVALTWDAAYAESDAYPLPTATTEGKLMLLDFVCISTAAGGAELMLTGQLERA